MDPFEYKIYFKTIGNTCEGYTPDVNNLDVNELRIIARAKSDAYIKSLREYLTSMIPGKYWDNNGLFCTDCIKQSDLAKLIDKAQGPNGILTYIAEDFENVFRRFWNSLYPTGNINKKSGIITTTETRVIVYPVGQVVTYNLTVDYTNAQIPSKALYTEYRTKLGILMQKVKEYHYMSLKMPFTVFTPPVS
jgi:hypothetical protein